MADEQKSSKKGPVEKINDINEIIKASTKASKALQPAITAYIGTVIETIKKFSEVDDATIRKFILSASALESKDGENMAPKSDDPLLIVKVMDSMSQVVSKIPKAVQNIAGLDFGRKTLRQFRNNVKHLPMMFSAIFKDMINELKVVLDDDATNLLKMIGGEGDIITKTKQIYSQHEMHEEEKTQKAAPSLLDTFLKLFGIFDSIDKISKTPISLGGIIQFRLAVKVYVEQFSMLVNTLYDGFMKPFFEKFSTDGKLNKEEFKAQWDSFENMIDSISEFTETVDDMIVKNLVKFAIKMSTFGALIRHQLAIFGNGTDKKPGILKLILNLCESDAVKKISAASEKDVIDGVTSIVHSIATMANELMVFAGFWIKGQFIRLGISSLSLSIISLVKLLEKLKNVKNLDDASKTISNIEDLIGGVRSIAMKIIWLTPIAAIAALVSTVLIVAIALVLTSIVAIVGLLWVTSKILDKIKLGGVFIKISLLIIGLTIIMTQMLILAVVCMALSMVVEQISLMNIIKFIGEFILLIIIFSVLGLVVSSVGTYILPFGLIMLLTIAFMIVLMGTLVIFSVACMAFEKISSLVKFEALISNILNITKIVLCIGALAALLGLLIVPFILPIMLGVGFMMMIVGALVLLAIGLKLLEVIDLDPDKVRSGVKTVLDTAMMVIDTIFNTAIDHGEEDGFWSKMLKIVTGPVGMLLKTMLSAQILLASIISVFAILLIASQLRLIQELNLDPEGIKKNVRIALDTVKYIIDLVFSPYTSEEDSESKPWYTQILDWMGGTVKKLLYPIMMISTLATSVVAVGAILLIAKQLEILQKLELKTEDIKNNVRSVIDVCKSIISAIWNTDTGEEKSTKGFGLSSLLELVFPEYVQMMHAIMSVGFLSISLISVGLIKKLAEHLTTLNNMPDLSGVKNKVSNVIGAAKEVIDSVFTGKSKILSFLSNSVNFTAAGKNLTDMNNALSMIVKMSKSIEEIELSDVRTENHRKFMENNIKFLDKINTTDLTKLKTTANMFEKMAQFSESINGNFEGLADTLNEKIAPLMEELKELLEGVQDKVEETGANVSKAAYNSGKNLSEPEMQAQVNSENPKAEAEEKARIVQQRMEEQARAQTNAITSKLDELIELMRSGMVQVRTV